MTENSKKALIVAYYLSKFDAIAYKNLGIGSKKQTHKYIGDILGINPNTIKNMRDNFDPYEKNSRAGWYQRPLPPSRVDVREAFLDIDEPSFLEIVKGILAGRKLEYLVENITNNSSNIDNSPLYEGMVKEVTFLQKTRNREIIKQVKKRDSYTCQACGFYYEDKIVEAHHLSPISTMDEEYLVTSEHLVTLCPNCHALAHVLLLKDVKYTNRDVLISQIRKILKLS